MTGTLTDLTFKATVERAIQQGGEILLLKDDLAVVRFGTTKAQWSAVGVVARRLGPGLSSLLLHITLTIVTLGLWLIPWFLWALMTHGRKQRDRRYWESHVQRLEKEYFRIVEIHRAEDGTVNTAQLRGDQLRYAIEHFNVNPRKKGNLL